MKKIIYLIIVTLLCACSNSSINQTINTQIIGYRINIILTNPEGCNYTSIYFECQICNNSNRLIKIDPIKKQRFCYKEREKPDAFLVNGKRFFELSILSLPTSLKPKSTVKFDCFLRGYHVDGDFNFIKSKIEGEIINNLKYIELIPRIERKKRKFIFRNKKMSIMYQVNDDKPTGEISLSELKSIEFRKNEFSKLVKTKIEFISQ